MYLPACEQIALSSFRTTEDKRATMYVKFPVTILICEKTN